MMHGNGPLLFTADTSANIEHAQLGLLGLRGSSKSTLSNKVLYNANLEKVQKQELMHQK